MLFAARFAGVAMQASDGDGSPRAAADGVRALPQRNLGDRRPWRKRERRGDGPLSWQVSGSWLER